MCRYVASSSKKHIMASTLSRMATMVAPKPVTLLRPCQQPQRLLRQPTAPHDLWVIKEKPQDIFYSILDAKDRQRCILAFEQKHLADNMNAVIRDLDYDKTCRVESAGWSYMLDVCDITRMNLAVFRMQDEQLVCQKFFCQKST